jgi:hypothetical protein
LMQSTVWITVVIHGPSSNPKYQYLSL